jgi:hypothetical protein
LNYLPGTNYWSGVGSNDFRGGLTCSLDAALFAGNATEGIEGENHAEAQTWKKQPGSFGAHCEFGGPTRIRTWNQQIMSLLL